MIFDIVSPVTHILVETAESLDRSDAETCVYSVQVEGCPPNPLRCFYSPKNPENKHRLKLERVLRNNIKKAGHNKPSAKKQERREHLKRMKAQGLCSKIAYLTPWGPGVQSRVSVVLRDPCAV